ncbi:MAG: 4Fe-4S dicluster domain-containing protein [Limnochordia bacterium]|jgi:NAD-dependent dihydropyrimidine dehydrogenase PreA subunit
MAYVICEPCIGVKDTACSEVCPVECIHPMKDEEGFEEAEQLYINPDECIECGACAAECPVQAIFPEDEVPEEWQSYIEKNAKFFQE